jgi:hypothetical protein
MILTATALWLVVELSTFGPVCGAEEPTKAGLIGIQYGQEDFDDPQRVVVLSNLDCLWGKSDGFGRQWSARWEGLIVAPVDGPVDFAIESTNRGRVEIDGKVVADKRKEMTSGSVKMVKGRKYPIVISFSKGGKKEECSLKVKWSWGGQPASVIGESYLVYNADLDSQLGEKLAKAQEESEKQAASREKVRWPKKQVSRPPKMDPAGAKALKSARDPNPGVTLKNVSRDVKLSWTAGALAVSHDVYFGTDLEEVKNATTSSKAYRGRFDNGKEEFGPGKLAEGTYYYWRVDENSEEGVVRGDVWSFRTRGGRLVLQVDLAVPTCDRTGVWEGTAKPGWTIWAAKSWADMYMHDGVWLPSKKEPAAFAAGIEGTGVKAFLSTGSEGQLGIGVKGICRANLGGGGCPKGKAQGDPIANSWAYAVDWAGPYAGDIILVFKDLPAGVYELYSYHNHWEPCKQSTRNCLDCVCGMPPMPSITANPLPAKSKGPEQDRSDNILSNYRWNLPPGTGKGVTAIKNAYNVAPQHIYFDEELVPSLIKFSTDGSDVLIIYEADRTEPLYPDCARKGREGARGILNAFELISVDDCK